MVRQIFLGMLMAVGAWAHHSAAAEFDPAKPVTLTGTVTRMDWMNPHVFFWIDVRNPDGSLTNWVFESAAPAYLQRLGWTKPSLKVGDTVTVHAFRAKDVPNMAKTDSVTLPSGKLITTGRYDDQKSSK